MMKKQFIVDVILFFAMLLPNFLMAQGPTDPNDVLVPIDGGLSFLLAAGIGYGAKKAISARKK